MRSALTPFALSMLLAVAGCAIIVVPEDGKVRYETGFGSAVQGNGQVVSERREVAALGGIDINGPLQVEVRVGSGPTLQVEGDSNLLPMVRTDAAGGTLRVWVEGSIRTSNPLRVTYTTPALNQVVSNGSGRLTVSGLNGGDFEITQTGSRSTQLSGRVDRLKVRLTGSGGVQAAGLQSGATVASLNSSGRLELGRLQGDSLSLDVHGSGGVNAAGTVRSINVRLYGSGSADLAGLSSRGAELSTYGSGSITAGVSDSLVADSNGSGHITVYGNPAQRSVSGKRVSIIQ
jgi:hypothetical protein